MDLMVRFLFWPEVYSKPTERVTSMGKMSRPAYA
jgi:hypothetical protein